MAQPRRLKSTPEGNPYRIPSEGRFVLVADAFPAFALSSAMRGQSIDAVVGRAFNDGRGVVGEGGNTGPGVVGIAGGAIPNPGQVRSTSPG